MAYEYPAASDPFDEIMDRYRCREVDGLSSRCQLVVGHPVEHILERDGRWLVWPSVPNHTSGRRGQPASRETRARRASRSQVDGGGVVNR